MTHEIRRATVASVHHYGVVVALGDERLLVHAQDQSWYWPYDAFYHSRVGQECDVWVGDLERYGFTTRVASFRLVYPDLDPRRRFTVGSMVSGRVLAWDGKVLSVDFGPAQLADFHISDLRQYGVRTSGFAEADLFSARITSIDEDPTIILDPVS